MYENLACHNVEEMAVADVTVTGMTAVMLISLIVMAVEVIKIEGHSSGGYKIDGHSGGGHENNVAIVKVSDIFYNKPCDIYYIQNLSLNSLIISRR